MISVLSKFRRPRPRQSEPSREVSPVRTLRSRMILNATGCDNMPRPASRGVSERLDRNSNRDKSQGGPPAVRRSASRMARHEKGGLPFQHGKGRRYA